MILRSLARLSFIPYSVTHHFFHSLSLWFPFYFPLFFIFSVPSVLSSLYCRLLVCGTHLFLSLKGGSGGLTLGLNLKGLNLECLRIDQIVFSTVPSFVGFWNTTHTWDWCYSLGNKWLELYIALIHIPF